VIFAEERDLRERTEIREMRELRWKGGALRRLAGGGRGYVLPFAVAWIREKKNCRGSGKGMVLL
jgi:hypothetical protein